METMATKQPRPRPSLTPEFEADVVSRCRAGDRTLAQLANDFDLTETTVREWVEQADAWRSTGQAWRSAAGARAWSPNTDLAASLGKLSRVDEPALTGTP